MADYYEDWDDEFDCHYSVTVAQTESTYEGWDGEVHQMYINVKYVFNVAPDVRSPMAPSDDDGTPFDRRWCLQSLPRGFSGLRKEVVGLLDEAGFPSAAKSNTLRMIFDGVLDRQYRRRSGASVQRVVGVFVKTAAVTDSEDEDEDPIEEVESMEYYEDSIEAGDVEYDRAVDESMEEGFLYVKAKPTRREVVEALLRIRVWGERDTGCAICMDKFSFGIEATKMPCSHVFHGDCLAMWLERQCFCPLCRFELPSAEEEAVHT